MILQDYVWTIRGRDRSHDLERSAPTAVPGPRLLTPVIVVLAKFMDFVMVAKVAMVAIFPNVASIGFWPRGTFSCIQLDAALARRATHAFRYSLYADALLAEAGCPVFDDRLQCPNHIDVECVIVFRMDLEHHVIHGQDSP